MRETQTVHRPLAHSSRTSVTSLGSKTVPAIPGPSLPADDTLLRPADTTAPTSAVVCALHQVTVVSPGDHVSFVLAQLRIDDGYPTHALSILDLKETCSTVDSPVQKKRVEHYTEGC